MGLIGFLYVFAGGRFASATNLSIHLGWAQNVGGKQAQNDDRHRGILRWVFSVHHFARQRWGAMRLHDLGGTVISDAVRHTIERCLPLAQLSPFLRLRVQVPGSRYDAASRSQLHLGEIEIVVCSLPSLVEAVVEAPIAVLHYRIVRQRVDVLLRFSRPAWREDNVCFSTPIEAAAGWKQGLAAMQVALERKLPFVLVAPWFYSGEISTMQH